MLTFVLSMADTPSFIPTARPCHLLMFPDGKVRLEKEECVVFTVLTPDSKCAHDITTSHLHVFTAYKCFYDLCHLQMAIH